MSDRWPKWLSVNENLRDLKPYGAPQIQTEVRLNTNENPFTLDEELQSAIIEEVSKQVAHLNRYPDRDAVELRALLAAFINELSGTKFTKENIWAANGSNEILQSIALAFQGAAMGFEPSYSMHPLISRTVGKKWISIPRNNDFSLDVSAAINAINAHRPGLIFLTTPNNPTGGSIPLKEIAQIAQSAIEIGAIVVVDEAYAEFSTQPSAVTLIEQNPNLIVSRTMSKAFAFAGARLGYMIAAPILVEAMLLVRLPYHLSDLSQAAARAVLQNRVGLQREVLQLKENRSWLTSQLRQIGLSVTESDANFILFSGFTPSAPELWQSLVEHQVLVRDVGIPGHLRVTVGTVEENQKFITALQGALAL